MQTDLIEWQRAHRFDPPVRSLLDIDFYKFTMGQAIHQFYPDVEVTFSLIIRDQTVPVAEVVSEIELEKMLNYARGLSLKQTELYYLRGMDVWGKNMFSEDYLNFLRTFTLPEYKLRRIEGAYELTFTGPWKSVTYWETIGLAIISQLYYRALMANMSKLQLQVLYARAMDRVYTKLQKLQVHPGIKFADFGQRRRHSFLWQEWVLKACIEMMGKQFVGTSNTKMASNFNQTPTGTNAHEMPMVLAALANTDEELRYAQYRVPELWQQIYGEGLRVFLPDTFGSAQFFAHAPKWLTSWRGMRQDSGNPYAAGNLYLRWLERHKTDTKDKLIIFSDGLDVEPMIGLHEHFHPMVDTSFGWGTLLTNDFANCFDGPNAHLFRPFSVVCKVTRARVNPDSSWRPCVKLSDNPHKATGPKEEIARYLKIFGNDGRTEKQVVV